ncbi:SDR family NAD(P)-dependent oxidoreductase [Vibrio ostreicida]|uniref:SDR family oxidoreductase n=1 Tax=Vibrio ostreicida TaxID=526588 RepID=A0ABT8BM59_9VIBR|nr:SDR family oxidoreductase [Vibrio ostreicida]MDN3608222.1 SDR family oxidoreductase [Vibrio ostreicida]NPD09791.1 SDR family oxidoreductase [Vibrio ostreicida]
MKTTCIVTGGSSGIGQAIVQLFEKEGYLVFNFDIKEGPLGHHVPCDITDHQAVQGHIKHIAQNHNIDVLVTSAGVHFSADIENTSEQDLQRVFDINVKGTYSAVQAVLPVMKKQNSGSIIVVASEQGLVAKPNSFAYNLSKAALVSLAKTTAIDYAKFNIRANALCPGTIETPLYHKAIEEYCTRSGADLDQVHKSEAEMQPLGRIGKPEEVAQYALFLASDSATFITGSVQVIDGGYTTG